MLSLFILYQISNGIYTELMGCIYIYICIPMSSHFNVANLHSWSIELTFQGFTDRLKTIRSIGCEFFSRTWNAEETPKATKN